MTDVDDVTGSLVERVDAHIKAIDAIRGPIDKAGDYYANLSIPRLVSVIGGCCGLVVGVLIAALHPFVGPAVAWLTWPGTLLVLGAAGSQYGWKKLRSFETLEIEHAKRRERDVILAEQRESRRAEIKRSLQDAKQFLADTSHIDNEVMRERAQEELHAAILVLQRRLLDVSIPEEAIGARVMVPYGHATDEEAAVALQAPAAGANPDINQPSTGETFEYVQKRAEQSKQTGRR